MKISMEIRYEAGHSYPESWEPTEYFCPNCSKKDVWHEADTEGDYYAGEQFLCLACQHTFHFYSGPTVADGWQNRQRLEAIKPATEGVVTS